MRFAPDTELTLEFVVELANTAPSASKSGDDELSTPVALTALLQKWTYTGRFDRDDQELAEVLQNRTLFRRVWSLPTDEAVTEVNAMFREAGALPYLTKHDHYDWHLHATDQQAPLAERMRVEVAIALADVIRSASMDRLRVCGAEDCDGLLLDLSRNGSKVFCSVRCGNRVNQMAYRARAVEQ